MEVVCGGARTANSSQSTCARGAANQDTTLSLQFFSKGSSNALYASFPVFPYNNADLAYIYRLTFSATAMNYSLSHGPFPHFRSTYGQLCRFLVSVRVIPIHRLHEPGSVFDAVSEEVV